MIITENTIITGIDINTGIQFCGGRAEYAEVLKTFCVNAVLQITAMEEFYKSGDMNRFIIEVHALKSTAKGIGAESLGELAYSMERASKEGAKDFIEAKFPVLINEYRDITKQISDFLELNKRSKVGKIMDNDELFLKVRNIIKAAEEYDLDEARKIIEEITEYSFSPEIEAEINKIKVSILRFSYVNTIKEANNLLFGGIICKSE